LSYEDLRGLADAFLSKFHPSGAIPVPIEEIVEFGLEINIVPIPELLTVHDVDGFLSADMTEISVDMFILEKRPARYRFTLAHEAAHLVLHGEVLREVRPASIDDWRHFVRELPEKDREWLEWQAHCFAGLILVPREALAAAYREAVKVADEAGLEIESNFEIAKRYVAAGIGRLFDVSADVIERRLRYDGIWPR
jgi:Zn-dependent peptidase ImmA (M78 family)